MPDINGLSGPGMDYASEVYKASLAKSAQVQEGQQNLELIEQAAESAPAATRGSHATTDNLGQNININV